MRQKCSTHSPVLSVVPLMSETADWPLDHLTFALGTGTCLLI